MIGHITVTRHGKLSKTSPMIPPIVVYVCVEVGRGWSTIIPLLVHQVPTTPACTWCNRPEEDLSSGKLECCLPTPMTIASGGSLIFPPASPSIWSAVQSLLWGPSTNPGVLLKSLSCVWELQRGHSGDGCVLASTLCTYDLRKGDCLF